MARKHWKLKYKAEGDRSAIYANYKRGEFIERAGKQLGAFDNFKTEKWPVIVQGYGGHEILKKWFSTKAQANRYMRSYMRTH